MMSVTTPLSPLSVATALPLGQQRFWRTPLPQVFILFMLVPFAVFVTLAKLKPPDNLFLRVTLGHTVNECGQKDNRFLQNNKRPGPVWPCSVLNESEHFFPFPSGCPTFSYSTTPTNNTPPQQPRLQVKAGKFVHTHTFLSIEI